MYEPINKTWIDLSDPASGIPPSPRASHGFTAVDGLLYVHGGGYGGNGEKLVLREGFAVKQEKRIK